MTTKSEEDRIEDEVCLDLGENGKTRFVKQTYPEVLEEKETRRRLQ